MQSLSEEGKAPSTQQHFALDIEKFLTFLKTYSMPHMRLSVRAIDALSLKLKAWRKGLSPQVVVQQQEYKQKKTGMFKCWKCLQFANFLPILNVLCMRQFSLCMYMNVFSLNFLSSITENLLQSLHLLRFVEEGTLKLPEAMKFLTENITSLKALKQVVGLLVGVMAASTGHRRCIFLNMRPRDVMQAEKQKNTVTITVSTCLSWFSGK